MMNVSSDCINVDQVLFSTSLTEGDGDMLSQKPDAPHFLFAFGHDSVACKASCFAGLKKCLHHPNTAYASTMVSKF